MRSKLVVLFGLFACEKSPPAPPRVEGPMPIAFGDCAAASTTWVSGPRPWPLTYDHEAAATPTPSPPADAATATGSAAAPKDPHQAAIDEAKAFGMIAEGASSDDVFPSVVGDDNGATDIYGDGLGPSGGTGWGTIGTGRYGTIGGHHAGSYGVGGVGAPWGSGKQRPLSIGQPSAAGNLDKAIIRRYIRRNLSKLEYCYEKRLLVVPTLAGTLMARFTIDPKGAVTSAEASGLDAEVESCVVAAIKAIEFPAPKGGGNVQVNYPFTFKSTDTPPAGSAASATPLVDAAITPPVDAAVTPPAEPAAPAPSLPALFQTARAPAGASKYVPGAANPLKPEQAALTDCLRKNPQHYGAAVFDLAYDAGGAVTKANVSGVDDPETHACVLAIAQRVKRVTPAASAERCSLAFGEMPIADLSTVDITADAVVVDGKSVAALKDVPPIGMLDALANALAPKHRAVVVDAPVVAMHGPIVIRPLDATPMGAVVEVLATVLFSDDDALLAARRGTEWKLLSPVAFPVAPVPLGTGGRWARVKARSRATTIDPAHATLSVWIKKDHIAVGVSKAHTLIEAKVIPARTSQAVEDMLKQYKHSSFFTDRMDIEIAGDEDVPYGDVVMVIDAASTAGFRDWRITRPGGLAVQPPL